MGTAWPPGRTEKRFCARIDTVTRFCVALWSLVSRSRFRNVQPASAPFGSCGSSPATETTDAAGNLGAAEVTKFSASSKTTTSTVLIAALPS